MAQLSMTEIKRDLIEILECFDKYCTEHSLRYYLCGGALIGAVRHKGFIPWDDDIDVIMPRPDYEKLLAIENDYPIKENMKLFTFKKGNSSFLFTKLGNTKRTIYNQYITESEYLSMDIFPMDGMSDNMKENKKNYMRISFLKTIYSLHTWRVGHGTTPLIIMLKLLAYPFAKLIHHQYLGNRIDQIAQTHSFNNSEFVGDIIWGYGMREIVKKDDFIPQTTIFFEGKKFKTSVMYKKYLYQVYGDFMKLPPMEKRRNHELVVYKS